MYHVHGNHFGHTRMVLLGNVLLKWKLVLVRFEIVLVLAQDRYTVCAECSLGTEIIVGTPDHTPM